MANVDVGRIRDEPQVWAGIYGLTSAAMDQVSDKSIFRAIYEAYHVLRPDVQGLVNFALWVGTPQKILNDEIPLALIMTNQGSEVVDALKKVPFRDCTTLAEAIFSDSRDKITG